MDGVRVWTLRRACEILGGRPQLRKYLKVSAVSLGIWMAGSEPPPTDVFLKAVDVVVEHDVDDLRRRNG
jgi:hypothetical protein